jgi:hypothetical protein
MEDRLGGSAREENLAMTKKITFAPGEASEIAEELAEMGILVKTRRMRHGQLVPVFVAREFATQEEIEAWEMEMAAKRGNVS